jgi:hypothetical protein
VKLEQDGFAKVLFADPAKRATNDIIARQIRDIRFAEIKRPTLTILFIEHP